MGTIESNDDFFIIRVDDHDSKVHQEWDAVVKGFSDIDDFIHDSVQQMADFLLSYGNNETNVLRTPSRRMSKRKRSSIAISSTYAKRGVTAAVKTRDPAVLITPRRLSKRPKRSTISLETSVYEASAVKEVVVVESETICLEEEDNQQVIDIEIDDNTGVDEEVIVVDTNDVISASELMSELSIKVDENKAKTKANESDNEWMTDDEDNGQQEEKMDVVDESFAKKVKAKTKMNLSLISANNKTIVGDSKAKDKHKKSIYFTPQSSQRSTRAQTRIQSRIADTSSLKTPQTSSKHNCLRHRDVNTSDCNASKAVTSSARSVRSVSRTRQIAEKTDSAMKKRMEDEEARRVRLLASQEKEKKAMEKRRILIEQTVNEKKMRSQEKANRAAEMRQLQQQLESERQRKEMAKREECQRKREEERKEVERRRHEELLKKSLENERRKQMNELKERAALFKKQEELQRKQEQERELREERLREQEKMAALIQQHNSSLQQKALANSFIKKTESSTQLMAKVVISKLSPAETAPYLKVTTTIVPPVVEESGAGEEAAKNSTFVVPKESAQNVSSYDMTPPPKERDYDNYDISQIASGDDTDDESHPRKRIPGWARGHAFIKQVHSQYSKRQKDIDRDVKHIFGTGADILKQFEHDFDMMFAKSKLNPKYQQRSSSAVWDQTMCVASGDESSANESYYKC